MGFYSKKDEFMHKIYLPNEKFIPPSLPDIVVERSALLDAFDAAARERVVFVCAPGGYGKSVSVRMWLEKSARESVWIGLDRYDNTLSVFYRLLCSGLLSIQPDNEAIANVMHESSFSASPVEKSVEILSEFLPDDTPRALVFDDVHLISNPDIRKSLPFIIRRLPLPFVTIFISRSEFNAEKTNLAFGRDIPQISTDLLAFSSGEIKNYFDASGREITAAEAETVRSETGGWPLGVSVLASAGRTEAGGANGRLLDGYVRELIWDRWDEKQRDLLMRLSVVDELDTNIYRKLTDRDDSDESIESELRSNTFVTCTPNGTFRFHHLFLDFLRARAAESGINLRELHRRAALRYIDSAEYFKAWRHAIISEDTDAILNAAYHFKQYTNPSLDEYVSFYATFDESIPEEIMDRFPMLYTTKIWLCYLMGDAKSMAYYLDRMYLTMRDVGEKFPQFMENAMLVVSLDPRPPFENQVEYLSTLIESADVQNTPQATTLTHWMPFFHRSNRDYCELVDESIVSSMTPVFTILLKENYDTFIRYMTASLKLERNRISDAASIVADDLAPGAMDKLIATVSDEVAFSVFVFHSALEYASGNPAKGKVWAMCAENHIESSGALYLYPNFLAFKLRMQMLDGSVAAAREWLGQYFVSEPERFELYKIYQYLTSVRAHIILGEMETALRYLDGIYKLASDFNRPLDMAEACVLRSIAEWQSGKHKKASLSISEAVSITQPYGFVRVIADEGSAVIPLLKKISAKAYKGDGEDAVDADYIASVVSATVQQTRKYRGITSQIVPLKINLTDRQKKLLSLLAQGKRGSEIAETLNISLHTVKSHKTVLYRKLRVNNTAGAISRGKEMGLLG